MNYLAKCTPDCRSFKGDTGPVWVKVDQMGFNKTSNPQRGSDKLARQGSKWYITIPRSLAPGEYLLRYEILGLHVAGKRMGAQFYPSVCKSSQNEPGKLVANVWCTEIAPRSRSATLEPHNYPGVSHSLVLTVPTIGRE
jgi:hypothetical protein